MTSQNGDNAGMLRCYICGSTQATPELVSEFFMIEGKRILVEGIPASVCASCGEVTFDRETTQRVRLMVHGGAQPVRVERTFFACFAAIS